MKDIVLEAQVRAGATKGEAKAIRRTGRVPAIAYGDKETPMSISIDEKSVQSILHSEGGRNALINLKIGSASHPVLIKEIQRHPITRALQHVDFHRISLKQKIETKVPLHVKGEAPGVKLGGGVLEHLVREIRVRCLPTEIPAAVDVDISKLELNQAFRAKDLTLPKGVEILMDAESVIVHVVTVHIVEETTVTPEAAVAGATAAEPEVIKKGKVEEGAEGAAPAAGDKKAAAGPGAKPTAGAPAATPPPKGGGAKPEAKKPEGK